MEEVEAWRGHLKYSREREGILKVVRGSGSRRNGKGEVLQGPLWGECKFSQEAKEVPNHPQQNHANGKKSRQSWQSIRSVEVQEGG